MKRPKEFKVIYSMIWAQLAILTSLYWFTAINIKFWTKFARDGKNADAGFLIVLVMLKYIPTIMMTLIYVLIYFQMQSLFVISRVKQRSSKVNQNQAMKIIKIITWILMAFFVIVEFMLIVLVIASVINQTTFEI